MRNSKGQYTTNYKRMLFTLIVFGVVLYVFNAGFNSWYDKNIMPVSFQRVAAAVDPSALASQMFEKKVSVLRSEVIDTIETCESGKVGGNYGLIVFDSNNEASVAGMQYQRKTVITYVKKFYQKEIGAQEAIALAIDRTQARELADHIIFEEDAWKDKDGRWHGSWANWFNCSSDNNLRQRVDIIKELMK